MKKLEGRLRELEKKLFPFKHGKHVLGLNFCCMYVRNPRTEEDLKQTFPPIRSDSLPDFANVHPNNTRQMENAKKAAREAYIQKQPPETERIFQKRKNVLEENQRDERLLAMSQNVKKYILALARWLDPSGEG